MSNRIFALAGALVLIAKVAFAHHPGERVNEVMAAREPAFEAVDHRAAPDFELVSPTGDREGLADFDGKVLVMSFLQEDCAFDCARQQQALAAVQRRVNISPMGKMVAFVTIVAPGTTLPDALQSLYDPANWQMLATDPGTDDPAAAYAAVSSQPNDAPMTFVVDRNGRLGGIFHGAEFGQVNMLLYINDLTNEHEKRPPTLWQRIGALLW